MRTLYLVVSERISKVVEAGRERKQRRQARWGRSLLARPSEPPSTPSLRAKTLAVAASAIALVVAGTLTPLAAPSAGGQRPLGQAALASSSSGPTRDMSTIAGGVGIGQGTGVGQSTDDLFVDPAGNVYVADQTFQVLRKLSSSTGAETVVAGDGNNGGMAGFNGDGGPATAAQLWVPAGGAVDSSGNVVFADSFNNRVRLVAAVSGTFFTIPMTAGDIYTVAGTSSTVCLGHTDSIGDGCPGTQATLSSPGDVAIDAHGNLVIADSADNRIRVVAAATGTFYGVSMTAGDIYTVAGGGATTGCASNASPTSVVLDDPGAVTVDSHGNLVIADGFHDCVRVVAASSGTYFGVSMATAGNIYTVAGGGAAGCGATAGAATSAALDDPGSVAVDSHGNLVIADSFDNCVRVVAAATASYYGQSMTAGDIYTGGRDRHRWVLG